MQLDRIRPSHRMRAEILALEPGRGAAITEPQHELAMHPHSPAVAAKEAHDIDVLLVAGQRHEADQSHRALIGDRKGVTTGKGQSVLLSTGGSRIIKKTTNK